MYNVNKIQIQKKQINIIAVLVQVLSIVVAVYIAVNMLINLYYTNEFLNDYQWLLSALLMANVYKYFADKNTELYLEKYANVAIGIMYAEAFLCTKSESIIVFVLIAAFCEGYSFSKKPKKTMQGLIAFVVTCEAMSIFLLFNDIVIDSRIYEFITSFKLDVILIVVIIFYEIVDRFELRIKRLFKSVTIWINVKNEKMIVLVTIIVVLILTSFASSLLLEYVLQNKEIYKSLTREEVLFGAVDIHDFEIQEDGTLVAVTNDPWIMIDLNEIDGLDKSRVKTLTIDVSELYTQEETIEIFTVGDIDEFDTYKQHTMTIQKGHNTITLSGDMADANYIRMDLLEAEHEQINFSAIEFNSVPDLRKYLLIVAGVLGLCMCLDLYEQYNNNKAKREEK